MSWDTNRYEVVLELLDPMLGTTPCSKSIWAAHIATKQQKKLKKEGWDDAKIEAELTETIEGVADLSEEDSGKTTFMMDKKGYYVRDYFVKGFFKQAAKVLKQYGPLKQLRSKVVQFLFVTPRKIYVAGPKDELQLIERPLRASTPQGERVAIARSFAVPTKTRMTFTVDVLKDVLEKQAVRTLLEYGEYEGMGQWRGSGHGRFKIVSLK